MKNKIKIKLPTRRRNFYIPVFWDVRIDELDADVCRSRPTTEMNTVVKSEVTAPHFVLKIPTAIAVFLGLSG
jgi:hypothetical protein